MGHTCVTCAETSDQVDKHYSCWLCNGCRAFFKRVIQKKVTLTECKRGGNCVINVETRKSCKDCRYKKCLEAGCDPNKVQAPRYVDGTPEMRAQNGPNQLQYQPRHLFNPHQHQQAQATMNPGFTPLTLSPPFANAHQNHLGFPSQFVSAAAASSLMTSGLQQRALPFPLPEPAYTTSITISPPATATTTSGLVQHNVTGASSLSPHLARRGVSGGLLDLVVANPAATEATAAAAAAGVVSGVAAAGGRGQFYPSSSTPQAAMDPYSNRPLLTTLQLLANQRMMNGAPNPYPLLADNGYSPLSVYDRDPSRYLLTPGGPSAGANNLVVLPSDHPLLQTPLNMASPLHTNRGMALNQHRLSALMATPLSGSRFHEITSMPTSPSGIPSDSSARQRPLNATYPPYPPYNVHPLYTPHSPNTPRTPRMPYLSRNQMVRPWERTHTSPRSQHTPLTSRLRGEPRKKGKSFRIDDILANSPNKQNNVNENHSKDNKADEATCNDAISIKTEDDDELDVGSPGDLQAFVPAKTSTPEVQEMNGENSRPKPTVLEDKKPSHCPNQENLPSSKKSTNISTIPSSTNTNTSGRRRNVNRGSNAPGVDEASKKGQAIQSGFQSTPRVHRENARSHAQEPPRNNDDQTQGSTRRSSNGVPSSNSPEDRSPGSSTRERSMSASTGSPDGQKDPYWVNSRTP